jgi:hypothetical protein
MNLKNKLNNYEVITNQDLYNNFTKVELVQLLCQLQSRQVMNKKYFHNYLSSFIRIKKEKTNAE